MDRWWPSALVEPTRTLRAYVRGTFVLISFTLRPFYKTVNKALHFIADAVAERPKAVEGLMVQLYVL
jgi:hypothetical protein